MSKPNQTNFLELLPDLNAGVLLQKIERALSDVALGVVSTGKKGSVSITLDFKQISDSHQVAVAHTVEYVLPTDRGKQTEVNTTETPLYVNQRGRLTLFPDAKTDDMFASKSAPERDDA